MGTHIGSNDGPHPEARGTQPPDPGHRGREVRSTWPRTNATRVVLNLATRFLRLARPGHLQGHGLGIVTVRLLGPELPQPENWNDDHARWPPTMPMSAANRRYGFASSESTSAPYLWRPRPRQLCGRP